MGIAAEKSCSPFLRYCCYTSSEGWGWVYTFSAQWVGLWSHGQNTDSNGGDIWAPELHYINGGWYIYFAADNGNNDNHHLFVLTTSGGPTSPFYEANTGLAHGQLNESTGNWAIDPDVFTAADGSLYVTWSCTNQHNSQFPQRICLAPMSNPLTISGGTQFLSTPNQPWETRDAAIQEGPVGYTRNGRSYITYSGSASYVAKDYAVGLLTLAQNGSPTNVSVWSKCGPIFDHHSTAYGTGSVVFVQSPNGNEFWNMYHGIDKLNCSPNAYACRDIRMQKMYFDPVGYPVLGYPMNPSVTLNDPSGEGGIFGGTTAVGAFGAAWGDAAEGNNAGQVSGNWSITDRFTASSSTGGAWD